MGVRGEEALTLMSAGELATAIARGEVSAAEAVEAHIARIEAVNPAINAVVVKTYERARAEARAADERRAKRDDGEPLAPLHGVPITIKESLDLEGTPSTFGVGRLARGLAPADDPYVARLRAAGAIVLGKTNVAQLLMYIESDNPVYGRTVNPWNPERAVGGSSGGQAAILAAGGVPLGLGTDIGGSLRFPAAFCGVASLKPTAGRTPDRGASSAHIGQRAVVSQVGPMARSVDDLALALGIIAGDPDGAPPPLGDPASVDVSRLRVAYYADDGTLAPAASVRRAVSEAAGILAGRGARVTEWRPPEVRRALDLWLGIIAADGAAHFARVLRGSKRDPRIAANILLARRSRPTLAVLGGLLRVLGQRDTADLVRNFGHRDALHYWDLVEAQTAYQRRFAQALGTDEGGPFDVIVCPACAVPAIPHGASRDLTTGGGYNPLYNVLGYPAGIVPVSRVRPGEEAPRRATMDIVQRAARRAEVGSAGLPLGVQVVARPWREHVALAAMRAIQEAARAGDDYPALAPL